MGNPSLRVLTTLLAEEVAALSERGLSTYRVGTVRQWAVGKMRKTREGWVRANRPRAYARPRAPATPSTSFSPAAPPSAEQPAHTPARPVTKAVLDELGALQAKGVLPKAISPEEHQKIAEDFLAKHEAGLKETLSSLDLLAQQTLGKGRIAVTGRAKTVESALSKLTRKPETYPRADKLTDGTGLRVVCGSVADVLKMVQAVKKKHRVIEEEDYITRTKGGYRSFHMLIEDADGLTKEVQIRTPNQDKWAEWCHNVYKPMTLEQTKVMAEEGAKVLSYGEQMSAFYFAQDQGKSPPPPELPQCPLVVKQTFGCMPTEPKPTKSEAVEKKATTSALPDDPWRYFEKPPGAVLVPVAQLRTLRADQAEIGRAAEHMAKAYNGTGKKRKPVSLKKDAEGTYAVLDGNSTTAIARRMGWTHIVAVVEDVLSSRLRALSVRLRDRRG